MGEMGVTRQRSRWHLADKLAASCSGRPKQGHPAASGIKLPQVHTTFPKVCTDVCGWAVGLLPPSSLARGGTPSSKGGCGAVPLPPLVIGWLSSEDVRIISTIFVTVGMTKKKAKLDTPPPPTPPISSKPNGAY